MTKRRPGSRKPTDKERLDWLSKMVLWVHWNNISFERRKGKSLRVAIDAASRKERTRG